MTEDFKKWLQITSRGINFHKNDLETKKLVKIEKITSE